MHTDTLGLMEALEGHALAQTDKRADNRVDLRGLEIFLPALGWNKMLRL